MIATFLSSRKVPDIERCVTFKKTLHRERVPLYPGVEKEETSLPVSCFLTRCWQGNRVVSRSLTLPKNMGSLWLMTKIPPFISFRILSAGRLIWYRPSWLNIECEMF